MTEAEIAAVINHVLAHGTAKGGVYEHEAGGIRLRVRLHWDRSITLHGEAEGRTWFVSYGLAKKKPTGAGGIGPLIVARDYRAAHPPATGGRIPPRWLTASTGPSDPAAFDHTMVLVQMWSDEFGL